MQDAPVDDEVVARHDRQVAELGFERPLALGHVHDLITLRVAVEVRIVDGGDREVHSDVVVVHHQLAIERRTATCRKPRRPKMAVLEQPVRFAFVLYLLDPPHRLDRRRRMQVIEQR